MTSRLKREPTNPLFKDLSPDGQWVVLRTGRAFGEAVPEPRGN